MTLPPKKRGGRRRKSCSLPLPSPLPPPSPHACQVSHPIMQAGKQTNKRNCAALEMMMHQGIFHENAADAAVVVVVVVIQPFGLEGILCTGECCYCTCAWWMCVTSSYDNWLTTTTHTFSSSQGHHRMHQSQSNEQPIHFPLPTLRANRNLSW